MTPDLNETREPRKRYFSFREWWEQVGKWVPPSNDESRRAEYAAEMGWTSGVSRYVVSYDATRREERGRIHALVASLRSEAHEAHNEEAWGFEPMAKMKTSIADRIDAALGGRSPDAGDAR
jgi:hypothetical protein